MSPMFELMLQLPVFQGLSEAQLTEVLEKVPFGFRKFHPGEFLEKSGDPCNEVFFILSGKVRLVTPTFRNSITITEDFEAPHTMSFHHLFGRSTCATGTLYAVDHVGAMMLDKEHFMQVIEKNRVMLVNVLNMLSSQAQKMHQAMDFAGENEAQYRLASWMLAYTTREAVNIEIEGNVTSWCSLLNVTHETFKKCLKNLESSNCVEVVDGKLKLTDRYGLRQYVRQKLAQK